MSAYLETLNEQQKKAVTAPRGNCLVVAGAGTGKTRVVVSRIAYILKELKDPAYSVMAMTFTNKAAKELKTRLQELCQDVPHLERLWTGTFHGLCARFLRIYAAEAGLPEDFIILDSDGQKRQIADILRSEAFALREIASVAKEKKRLNVLTHYIASVKEKGLTPDLLQRQLLKGERRLPAELSEIPGTEVAEVYRAYERLCDAAGLVDFTGLLLKTRDLFRNNPGLRRAQHQRLRHILVDEFQDTDRIQYELVQLLAGPECSVMVVGDDDQSIYSWRGADPRNMHSFVEDYVNTQVIPLARNYRSPQTILDVANAVIGHSSLRLTEKRLESERKEGHKVVIKALTGPNDEAQWVAATLRELHDREGIDFTEMAVLYRNNSQSRAVEQALMEQGIPYVVWGGLKFYEREEVQNALAYFRLAVNEKDNVSFRRIINVPSRKLGPAKTGFLEKVAAERGTSLMGALRAVVLEAEENGSKAAARKIAPFLPFLKCMEEIEESVRGKPLQVTLEKILTVSGLKEMYRARDRADNADPESGRVANLEELMKSAGQFEKQYQDAPLMTEEGVPYPVCVVFLANISLMAATELDEKGRQEEETESGRVRSAVNLSTIHSAKGLEYRVVCVVGFEEGILPSSRAQSLPALDEERRLAYVAITRAKERLYLCYSDPGLFYRHYGSSYGYGSGYGSGYGRGYGGGYAYGRSPEAGGPSLFLIQLYKDFKGTGVAALPYVREDQ